jgi:BlaI family transcriptional regulator, penicillinase repressor
MDALYRLQGATVSEIVAHLPAEASYDAVRAVLRGLSQKQLVTHRHDGPRYVYAPAVPAEKERQRALDHLVRTFFAGSAEDAAAALLGMDDVQLSEDAIHRLARKIESSRREGQ